MLYKRKLRRLIKIISIITVFMFSINTVSWAYPDYARSNTLSVQSGFGPKLNDINLADSLYFEGHLINTSLHAVKYLIEDNQDIEFFRTIMESELPRDTFNSIKFEKVKVDKENGIITIFCEAGDKEERIIKVGVKERMKSQDLPGKTLYESDKYIIKTYPGEENIVMTKPAEKGLPDIGDISLDAVRTEIEEWINSKDFIKDNWDSETKRNAKEALYVFIYAIKEKVITYESGTSVQDIRNIFRLVEKNTDGKLGATYDNLIKLFETGIKQKNRTGKSFLSVKLLNLIASRTKKKYLYWNYASLKWLCDIGIEDTAGDWDGLLNTEVLEGLTRNFEGDPYDVYGAIKTLIYAVEDGTIKGENETRENRFNVLADIMMKYLNDVKAGDDLGRRRELIKTLIRVIPHSSAFRKKLDAIAMQIMDKETPDGIGESLVEEDEWEELATSAVKGFPNSVKVDFSAITRAIESWIASNECPEDRRKLLRNILPNYISTIKTSGIIFNQETIDLDIKQLFVAIADMPKDHYIGDAFDQFEYLCQAGIENETGVINGLLSIDLLTVIAEKAEIFKRDGYFHLKQLLQAAAKDKKGIYKEFVSADLLISIPESLGTFTDYGYKLLKGVCDAVIYDKTGFLRKVIKADLLSIIATKSLPVIHEQELSPSRTEASYQNLMALINKIINGETLNVDLNKEEFKSLYKILESLLQELNTVELRANNSFLIKFLLMNIPNESELRPSVEEAALKLMNETIPDGEGESLVDGEGEWEDLAKPVLSVKENAVTVSDAKAKAFPDSGGVDFKAIKSDIETWISSDKEVERIAEDAREAFNLLLDAVDNKKISSNSATFRKDLKEMFFNVSKYISNDAGESVYLSIKRLYVAVINDESGIYKEMISMGLLNDIAKNAKSSTSIAYLNLKRLCERIAASKTGIFRELIDIGLLETIAENSKEGISDAYSALKFLGAIAENNYTGIWKELVNVELLKIIAEKTGRHAGGVYAILLALCTNGSEGRIEELNVEDNWELYGNLFKALRVYMKKVKTEGDKHKYKKLIRALVQIVSHKHKFRGEVEKEALQILDKDVPDGEGESLVAEEEDEWEDLATAAVKGFPEEGGVDVKGIRREIEEWIDSDDYLQEARSRREEVAIETKSAVNAVLLNIQNKKIDYDPKIVKQDLIELFVTIRKNHGLLWGRDCTNLVDAFKELNSLCVLISKLEEGIFRDLISLKLLINIAEKTGGSNESGFKGLKNACKDFSKNRNSLYSAFLSKELIFWISNIGGESAGHVLYALSDLFFSPHYDTASHGRIMLYKTLTAYLKDVKLSGDVERYEEVLKIFIQVIPHKTRGVNIIDKRDYAAELRSEIKKDALEIIEKKYGDEKGESLIDEDDDWEYLAKTAEKGFPEEGDMPLDAVQAEIEDWVGSKEYIKDNWDKETKQNAKEAVDIFISAIRKKVITFDHDISSRDLVNIFRMDGENTGGMLGANYSSLTELCQAAIKQKNKTGKSFLSVNLLEKIADLSKADITLEYSSLKWLCYIATEDKNGDWNGVLNTKVLEGLTENSEGEPLDTYFAIKALIYAVEDGTIQALDNARKAQLKLLFSTIMRYIKNLKKGDDIEGLGSFIRILLKVIPYDGDFRKKLDDIAIQIMDKETPDGTGESLIHEDDDWEYLAKTSKKGFPEAGESDLAAIKSEIIKMIDAQNLAIDMETILKAILDKLILAIKNNKIPYNPKKDAIFFKRLFIYASGELVFNSYDKLNFLCDEMLKAEKGSYSKLINFKLLFNILDKSKKTAGNAFQALKWLCESDLNDKDGIPIGLFMSKIVNSVPDICKEETPHVFFSLMNLYKEFLGEGEGKSAIEKEDSYNYPAIVMGSILGEVRRTKLFLEAQGKTDLGNYKNYVKFLLQMVPHNYVFRKEVEKAAIELIDKRYADGEGGSLIGEEEDGWEDLRKPIPFENKIEEDISLGAVKAFPDARQADISYVRTELEKWINSKISREKDKEAVMNALNAFITAIQNNTFDFDIDTLENDMINIFKNIAENREDEESPAQYEKILQAYYRFEKICSFSVSEHDSLTGNLISLALLFKFLKNTKDHLVGLQELYLLYSSAGNDFTGVYGEVLSRSLLMAIAGRTNPKPGAVYYDLNELLYSGANDKFIGDKARSVIKTNPNFYKDIITFLSKINLKDTKIFGDIDKHENFIKLLLPIIPADWTLRKSLEEAAIQLIDEKYADGEGERPLEEDDDWEYLEGIANVGGRGDEDTSGSKEKSFPTLEFDLNAIREKIETMIDEENVPIDVKKVARNVLEKLLDTMNKRGIIFDPSKADKELEALFMNIFNNNETRINGVFYSLKGLCDVAAKYETGLINIKLLARLSNSPMEPQERGRYDGLTWLLVAVKHDKTGTYNKLINNELLITLAENSRVANDLYGFIDSLCLAMSWDETGVYKDLINRDVLIAVAKNAGRNKKEAYQKLEKICEILKSDKDDICKDLVSPELLVFIAEQCKDKTQGAYSALKDVCDAAINGNYYLFQLNKYDFKALYSALRSYFKELRSGENYEKYEKVVRVLLKAIPEQSYFRKEIQEAALLLIDSKYADGEGRSLGDEYGDDWEDLVRLARSGDIGEEPAALEKGFPHKKEVDIEKIRTDIQELIASEACRQDSKKPAKEALKSLLSAIEKNIINYDPVTIESDIKELFTVLFNLSGQWRETVFLSLSQLCGMESSSKTGLLSMENLIAISKKSRAHYIYNGYKNYIFLLSFAGNDETGIFKRILTPKLLNTITNTLDALEAGYDSLRFLCIRATEDNTGLWQEIIDLDLIDVIAERSGKAVDSLYSALMSITGPKIEDDLISKRAEKAKLDRLTDVLKEYMNELFDAGALEKYERLIRLLIRIIPQTSEFRKELDKAAVQMINQKYADGEGDDLVDISEDDDWEDLEKVENEISLKRSSQFIVTATIVAPWMHKILGEKWFKLYAFFVAPVFEVAFWAVPIHFGLDSVFALSIAGAIFSGLHFLNMLGNKSPPEEKLKGSFIFPAFTVSLATVIMSIFGVPNMWIITSNILIHSMTNYSKEIFRSNLSPKDIEDINIRITQWIKENLGGMTTEKKAKEALDALLDAVNRKNIIYKPETLEEDIKEILSGVIVKAKNDLNKTFIALKSLCDTVMSDENKVSSKVLSLELLKAISIKEFGQKAEDSYADLEKLCKGVIADKTGTFRRIVNYRILESIADCEEDKDQTGAGYISLDAICKSIIKDNTGIIEKIFNHVLIENVPKQYKAEKVGLMYARLIGLAEKAARDETGIYKELLDQDIFSIIAKNSKNTIFNAYTALLRLCRQVDEDKTGRSQKLINRKLLKSIARKCGNSTHEVYRELENISLIVAKGEVAGDEGLLDVDLLFKVLKVHGENAYRVYKILRYLYQAGSEGSISGITKSEIERLILGTKGIIKDKNFDISIEGLAINIEFRIQKTYPYHYLINLCEAAAKGEIRGLTLEKINRLTLAAKNNVRKFKNDSFDTLTDLLGSAKGDKTGAYRELLDIEMLIGIAETGGKDCRNAYRALRILYDDLSRGNVPNEGRSPEAFKSLFTVLNAYLEAIHANGDTDRYEELVKYLIRIIPHHYDFRKELEGIAAELIEKTFENGEGQSLADEGEDDNWEYLEGKEKGFPDKIELDYLSIFKEIMKEIRTKGYLLRPNHEGNLANAVEKIVLAVNRRAIGFDSITVKDDIKKLLLNNFREHTEYDLLDRLKSLCEAAINDTTGVFKELVNTELLTVISQLEGSKKREGYVDLEMLCSHTSKRQIEKYKNILNVEFLKSITKKSNDSICNGLLYLYREIENKESEDYDIFLDPNLLTDIAETAKINTNQVFLRFRDLVASGSAGKGRSKEDAYERILFKAIEKYLKHLQAEGNDLTTEKFIKVLVKIVPRYAEFRQKVDRIAIGVLDEKYADGDGENLLDEEDDYEYLEGKEKGFPETGQVDFDALRKTIYKVIETWKGEEYLGFYRVKNLKQIWDNFISSVQNGEIKLNPKTIKDDCIKLFTAMANSGKITEAHIEFANLYEQVKYDKTGIFKKLVDIEFMLIVANLTGSLETSVYGNLRSFCEATLIGEEITGDEFRQLFSVLRKRLRNLKASGDIEKTERFLKLLVRSIPYQTAFRKEIDEAIVQLLNKRFSDGEGVSPVDEEDGGWDELENPVSGGVEKGFPGAGLTDQESIWEEIKKELFPEISKDADEIEVYFWKVKYSYEAKRSLFDLLYQVLESGKIDLKSKTKKEAIKSIIFAIRDNLVRKKFDFLEDKDDTGLRKIFQQHYEMLTSDQVKASAEGAAPYSALKYFLEGALEDESGTFKELVNYDLLFQIANGYKGNLRERYEHLRFICEKKAKDEKNVFKKLINKKIVEAVFKNTELKKLHRSFYKLCQDISGSKGELYEKVLTEEFILFLIEESKLKKSDNIEALNNLVDAAVSGRNISLESDSYKKLFEDLSSFLMKVRSSGDMEYYETLVRFLLKIIPYEAPLRKEVDAAAVSFIDKKYNDGTGKNSFDTDDDIWEDFVGKEKGLPDKRKDTEEFFNKVDREINNTRDKLVMYGNEIQKYVRNQSPDRYTSGIKLIDREWRTDMVRDNLDRILSDLDWLKENKEGEVPSEVNTMRLFIEDNIYKLEVHRIISSLMVLGREAKRKNQPLIVGIETGWIPECMKPAEVSKNIFCLVKEIRELDQKLHKMGLNNIEIVYSKKGADLGGKLGKVMEKRGARASNVIVIAADKTMNKIKRDSNLNLCPGKNNEDWAFFVGIDASNLDENKISRNANENKYPILQITRMIALALELRAIIRDDHGVLPEYAKYNKEVNEIILDLAEMKFYSIEELRIEYDRRRKAFDIKA